jgi:hypothetical protein
MATASDAAMEANNPSLTAVEIVRLAAKAVDALAGVVSLVDLIGA